MGDWQKKYRWERTWGDETGINGNKHEDYAAYDGDRHAGRIRRDLESHKKGQWFWAGSISKTDEGKSHHAECRICSHRCRSRPNRGRILG